MFIRTKSTPKSPRKTIQIVENIRKGKIVSQKIIQYIGVASNDLEEEKLKELAKQVMIELELAKQQEDKQLSLFAVTKEEMINAHEISAVKKSAAKDNKSQNKGRPRVGDISAILPGKSLAGKSLAGKSLAGKSLAGKSLAGKSLAGKSLAGKSLASNSPNKSVNLFDIVEVKRVIEGVHDIGSIIYQQLGFNQILTSSKNTPKNIIKDTSEDISKDNVNCTSEDNVNCTSKDISKDNVNCTSKDTANSISKDNAKDITKATPPLTTPSAIPGNIAKNTLTTTKKSLKDAQMLSDLVLSRIFIPASKRKQTKILDEQFGKSYDLNHIYRLMDRIHPVIDEIKTSVFNATQKLTLQKAELLFFDVTTLYFESIEEDELRKFGYSKDFRFNTTQLVLALASDENGLPIGYELFRGNKAEVSTLLESLNKWRKLFNIAAICFVGDRAMLSEANLQLLESNNIEYVVAAKLRKLKPQMIEQIFDETNYQIKMVGDELSWIGDFDISLTTKLDHLADDLIKVLKILRKMDEVNNQKSQIQAVICKAFNLDDISSLEKILGKIIWQADSNKKPPTDDNNKQLSTDDNKQIPISTDNNKQLPISTDDNKQLPISTDDNKQLPISTDNNKQLPTDNNYPEIIRKLQEGGGIKKLLTDISNKLSKDLQVSQFNPLKIYQHHFANHQARRLIVSYKTKRAIKDQKDRMRILQKVEKILGGKNSKASSKKLITNGALKKYTITNQESKHQLNEAQIKQEELWDGLHGCITNIKDKSPGHILSIYARLWMIEDCFRVNKHNLKMRPIYHFLPHRIEAHIAICYMGFAVLRHLQYRVNLTTKISVHEIIDELANVQSSILLDPSTGNYYRLPGHTSQKASKIYKSFGMVRSQMATVY